MIKLLLLLNMAFADYVCVIKDAGDLPKLKFKGKDQEEARYRTAKECLSLRIQKYHAFRLSAPSDERKIMFMEDCVNRTYCVELKTKEK